MGARAFRRIRPLVVRDDGSGGACASCGTRHFSVCGAITDAHLDRLAATATAITVTGGVALIHEGDPATDFFNVTAGTIKLFKLLPDGREQITGFAGPGHFLGLASTDTYGFSAESIEPARLCRFPRAGLRRLMADEPLLEHRILETACHDLALAEERMLLLGRRTATERVASFLLGRLALAGPGDPADRIRLPMTRAQIADYLGLTIETVSRILGRFKAARRIALPTPAIVVILDRPWLEETAAGG